MSRIFFLGEGEGIAKSTVLFRFAPFLSLNRGLFVVRLRLRLCQLRLAVGEVAFESRMKLCPCAAERFSARRESADESCAMKLSSVV